MEGKIVIAVNAQGQVAVESAFDQAWTEAVIRRLAADLERRPLAVPERQGILLARGKLPPHLNGS